MAECVLVRRLRGLKEGDEEEAEERRRCGAVPGTAALGDGDGMAAMNVSSRQATRNSRRRKREVCRVL